MIGRAKIYSQIFHQSMLEKVRLNIVPNRLIIFADLIFVMILIFLHYIQHAQSTIWTLRNTVWQLKCG